MLLLLFLLLLLMFVVVVVVHVFVVIVVVVDPTNLPLKFGYNRVRNSWDFDNIEFVVVGGDVYSHFRGKPNFWVVVELEMWQYVSPKLNDCEHKNVGCKMAIRFFAASFCFLEVQ